MLALVAGAVALAVTYAVTPATALGLRGEPGLAHANTRYAIPALILAAVVLAWTCGRAPRALARALEAALAIGVVAGAREGYELGGAGELVRALAGLALLAGGAWLLWRLRERRAVLAVAAVATALVGLAGAHRVAHAIDDGRYRGVDPALDVLLDASPPGTHVGLAFATYWSLGDLSPAWPAFGARLDNDVEFVGEFVDGFLSPYRDEAAFVDALRRGDYDVLAVGRSPIARQNTPAQRWAIAAGWRTIGLSDRMRVLVPPR